MEKLIAFDLFTKNAHGGHTLVDRGPVIGIEVYRAHQVEALVELIPAYLMDPLDSHYCASLADAVKSLMESGR
jgi:hypothetical protein